MSAEDDLKIKPSEEADFSGELGSWHANLLKIDRRKCVLFTHDTTLYSFFVPGLKKLQFQNFREVFGQNLFKNLRLESFPQNQIEAVLDEHREIVISKTNNRSVLGSMNDLAYQLKYGISSVGGLAYVDLAELNHGLNRVPMGAIKEIYSIYELRKLLNQTKHITGRWRNDAQKTARVSDRMFCVKKITCLESQLGILLRLNRR